MPDGPLAFMRQNNVAGELVFWGTLTDSLETYFPKLEQEIEKYADPYVFGYSMGGILAVLYAKRKNAWNKIKKIITVAAPLPGIIPELAFLGKAIQETVPGSPIIKEILDLHPPENKVLSLFANEDKFTPNPERIKLNWPSIILSAGSHGDIQNHHKWTDEIFKKQLGISK